MYNTPPALAKAALSSFKSKLYTKCFCPFAGNFWRKVSIFVCTTRPLLLSSQPRATSRFCCVKRSSAVFFSFAMTGCCILLQLCIYLAEESIIADAACDILNPQCRKEIAAAVENCKIMGLIQQFIFPFDFRGFHDFFILSTTSYFVWKRISSVMAIAASKSSLSNFSFTVTKAAIIRRVAIIGIVMQRKITENLVFHWLPVSEKNIFPYPACQEVLSEALYMVTIPVARQRHQTSA